MALAVGAITTRPRERMATSTLRRPSTRTRVRTLAVACLAASGVAGFGAQDTGTAHPGFALEQTVRAYVSAVEREDLSEIDSLWSPDAAGRVVVLRGLRSSFLALDYRFSDVTVRVVTVDDARGRVQVAASREESGLTAEPRRTRWSRVLDLARVGNAWKIVAERTTADVLAEAVIATSTADGRWALLEQPDAAERPELAEALMRLADREHIERRLETAVVGYTAVLELSEQIPDPNLEVAALQNLGNIHYVRQEFDRALAMYERRLGVEQRRRNTRGVVVALQAIASAHYASSRYDLAQHAYERLVDLERAAGTVASLASTFANLGNVYYLQGSFEAALGAYREALDRQRQLADEAEQARLEFGVARALTALGSYAAALTYHHQALARREAGKSQAEQAASLQEVGRVYFLAGESAKALDAYGRAMAIETVLDNASGLGRLHLSKGLVFSTLGHYEDALSEYRASVTAFERAGERPSTGYGWLGAASVALEMGRPEDARVDYEKSAGVFTESQDSAGLSRALVGLSMAHLEQRAFESALEMATRAALLAAQAAAPESHWQAEYQRGRALWFLGRRLDAKTAYEKAATLLDNTRLEAASRNDDGRTLADRVAPFVAQVEYYASEQRPWEALMAAERQKARLIEELLHEHRWRLPSGLSDSERREERLLTGQLITSSQQRRRARARVPQVPELVEALDSRLARDRQSLRIFESKLVIDPAWRAARARRTVDEEELRHLARPGRLYLEFVSGDFETYLLALRRADEGEPEVEVHTLGLPRAHLDAQVEAFVARLHADDDGASGARALFDHLLGPVSARLGTADELVVVPDGPLWDLPFAALVAPDGTAVVDVAPLHYAVALLQRPDRSAPVVARGETAEASASVADTPGEDVRLGGRLTLNDVSPLHGTLSGAVVERLAASPEWTPIERASDGGAELRAMLSVRGLPRTVIIDEVAGGLGGDGAGVLGAVWALGTAGMNTAIWRRCDESTCADRGAVEALAEVWPEAPSPAAAVQRAAKRLRSGDQPQPPRVWAMLQSIGSVR